MFYLCSISLCEPFQGEDWTFLFCLFSKCSLRSVPRSVLVVAEGLRSGCCLHSGLESALLLIFFHCLSNQWQFKEQTKKKPNQNPYLQLELTWNNPIILHYVTWVSTFPHSLLKSILFLKPQPRLMLSLVGNTVEVPHAGGGISDWGGISFDQISSQESGCHMVIF